MRVLLAAGVLSLGFTLAGCEDAKLMAMFDGKKKLPGERKEVFPGGVPGVQQGVPPELMKGYQPPPEDKPPDVAAATAAPEPARVQQASAAPPPAARTERGGSILVGNAASGVSEPPKPKKRVAKPKPQPQPVAAAPVQQQPTEQAAPPQAATRPWPGASPSGPPSDRFSR